MRAPVALEGAPRFAIFDCLAHWGRNRKNPRLATCPVYARNAFVASARIGSVGQLMS